MTQEALKLALDALETELSIDWGNQDEFNASAEKMYEAIAAIKEALAQQEKDYERGFVDGMQKQMQSSVDKAVNRMAQYGYCPECGAKGVMRERRPNGNDKCANGHTYPSSKSTPPQPEQEPVADDFFRMIADRNPKPFSSLQRTWVGLEGEEIRNLWEEVTKPDRSTMTMVTSFARAIESKMKELNT